MKVVTEFLPNRQDKMAEEVKEWFDTAVLFMSQHPEEWVMVDEDPAFHRSILHTKKFEHFNKMSGRHFTTGWYETEFRYPEGRGCVMYGRWHEHTKTKIKRWLSK